MRQRGLRERRRAGLSIGDPCRAEPRRRSGSPHPSRMRTRVRIAVPVQGGRRGCQPHQPPIDRASLVRTRRVRAGSCVARKSHSARISAQQPRARGGRRGSANRRNRGGTRPQDCAPRAVCRRGSCESGTVRIFSYVLRAGRFQVESCAARKSRSSLTFTRSCVIESRWRTVTTSSFIVSPSIVTQKGVPISSWRR